MSHAQPKLRDNGVRVMIAPTASERPGTPLGDVDDVPGRFHPLEALQETPDAAIHLGMEQDIGSIAPGKLADLVIFEGDVLGDIRQSERVSTMLNGRLYEAATGRSRYR